MTNQNGVTPATEWQVQTKVLELPSGRRARLRPMDIGVFIKIGRIPNTLVGVLGDMAFGASGQANFKLDDLANLKDMMAFFDALCECVFVEPKVVENPVYENGEISPNDIDINDKSFVLAFFQNPAVELRSFRQKQEDNVADLQHSQDDGAESEHPDERKRVGKQKVGAD